MILRDFTADMDVLGQVYCGNEYRLPERFEPEDIILDIGAHIGVFALTCIRRGARRIVCYEPERTNFDLLRKNMAPYKGQVELHNAIIWRSDRPEQAKLTVRSGAFTASHYASAGDGDIVPTVSFDFALRRLGKVRLCKLDCEGAEYPAIYTSRELSRVQEFAGESHELLAWDEFASPCGGVGLVDFLGKNGFEAELVLNPRGEGSVNWFFARRRNADH